jgi:hypothetical protein
MVDEVKKQIKLYSKLYKHFHDHVVKEGDDPRDLIHSKLLKREIKRLSGGSLTSKQVNEFITSSYAKNVGSASQNIEPNYKLDTGLSSKEVKVYNDPLAQDKTVVVNRGTIGTAKDWSNNAMYAIGLYDKTDRFKNAVDVQNKAIKKYGKVDINIGHSQGAIITRKLKDKKLTNQIINVNPASMGEKQRKDETIVKSKSDIVSLLQPKGKTGNIIIKPAGYNPLTEHSADILKRIDPTTLIGKGRKKAPPDYGDKILWHTLQIKVPSHMVELTKTGKVSVKKTLNKTMGISKSQKQPAIRLVPSPDNAVHIVEGKEYNVDDLKSIMKKANKLRLKNLEKNTLTKAIKKTNPKVAKYAEAIREKVVKKKAQKQQQLQKEHGIDPLFVYGLMVKNAKKYIRNEEFKLLKPLLGAIKVKQKELKANDIPFDTEKIEYTDDDNDKQIITI